MAKVLRCKQIGPDAHCAFEAHGETNEDILQQVAEHAATVHGLTEIPDELVQKVIANIQTEQR